MNLLFEHGCIITENPQEEVIRDGWLLVSEGKILGLGKGDYPGPILPDRRIQAAGHAILPGIVDYHTHVCGSLFKGLTEDVDNGFYKLALPMEDVLAEARRLAEGGVVELTVIAQDTSAYGSDLYGKPMLRELLLELCKVPGLHWIRVLYTYPNTVDTDLIDAMVREPKLVPYLDMPIQHIAPDILRRMNRHGTAAHIREMAAYARNASPDFILRTTVITGFPGETEEEFDQLAEFLQANPFDRLGAFAYSQEENTPAAQMPDQIPDAVKAERLDRIMTAQQAISLVCNQIRVGRTYEVLVDKVQGDICLGRSYGEAPEVDGCIRFYYQGPAPKPGTFVQVRINQAGPYDLWGEMVLQ